MYLGAHRHDNSKTLTAEDELKKRAFWYGPRSCLRSLLNLKLGFYSCWIGYSVHKTDGLASFTMKSLSLFKIIVCI